MDVYNTHLNAWASIGIDLGEIARGKQIRQLGKLIATRSVALGIPYVVLGDFNAKEDSKNYPQMEAAFRALDAFRAFRPHDPGHTWDPANSWVPDFLALARIDYIWTSSLAAIDVLDSTVEFSEPNSDGKHLSDHYGVSARIARPQPGF